MEKGLIEVYCGDGKGKTTASLGLAIRAIAYNFKVCFIAFFKPRDIFEQGQGKVLRKLGIEVHDLIPIKLHAYRKMGFDEGRKRCLEALSFIEEIFQKDYDLLILDEMNIVLQEGYLRKEDILRFLEKKPKRLEIVFTGRGAPQWLIERADLVSEIRKIKHPFDQGIKERKGIDG
ncbi:Corrinoid adenosyltransferase [subsurface metagenome]